MKKQFATVLFSIATALCAEDTLPEQPSAALPQVPVIAVEKELNTTSYTYVRMGVSDTNAVSAFETIPSAGLGYRYAVSSAVIDVSATYTREYGSENYFYTVPKVSYLRYYSPEAEQSFYYGAGLAWGGLEKGADASFQGLVPNATVGIELNRNSAWRSFVQFEVSQPALAINAWNSYSISNLPAPLAEVSFGLGF